MRCPWWLRWKRIHLQCGRPRFDPWVEKVPWRREWQPSPVFLPGEFHEQRLQFMGSQRVGQDWVKNSLTFMLLMNLRLREDVVLFQVFFPGQITGALFWNWALLLEYVFWDCFLFSRLSLTCFPVWRLCFSIIWQHIVWQVPTDPGKTGTEIVLTGPSGVVDLTCEITPSGIPPLAT